MCLRLTCLRMSNGVSQPVTMTPHLVLSMNWLAERAVTQMCRPSLHADSTQDLAWGGVLLSHGGSWARSLPKADLWPLVVLPPILGALCSCNHPQPNAAVGISLDMV